MQSESTCCGTNEDVWVEPVHTFISKKKCTSAWIKKHADLERSWSATGAFAISEGPKFISV